MGTEQVTRSHSSNQDFELVCMGLFLLAKCQVRQYEKYNTLRSHPLRRMLLDRVDVETPDPAAYVSRFESFPFMIATLPQRSEKAAHPLPSLRRSLREQRF